MSSTGSVSNFLASQPVIILDGGLATELQAKGCDLDGDLWSARVLVEESEKIEQVHLDYLNAGSDCIVTSSYQATVRGFVQHGLSTAEATKLILGSVDLAVEARDEFWSNPGNRQGRLRPVVAAAIGPYGAYLADGSEFRGDYDLSVDELYDFHQPRWEILASSSADLMACETIPSGPEAAALKRLIAEIPQKEVWVSFTCPTISEISDGSDLRSIAADLSELNNVAAIGVNCTAPRLIPDLIATLKNASDKPIIVYPNSGEVWDQGSRYWLPGDPELDLATEAQVWHQLGAQLIGGCCRTTPKYIRRLRQLLIPARILNY